MAQLKDLIVNGASRLIGDVSANKIQLNTLNAYSDSTITTYGPGLENQVLTSNGTKVYWATPSPGTSVKGAAESTYRTGEVNLSAQNILGSTTIGGQYSPVYWNGTNFTEITAGTSAQFYRGDKNWSDSLTSSTASQVALNLTNSLGTIQLLQNSDGSKGLVDGLGWMLKNNSDGTHTYIQNWNTIGRSSLPVYFTTNGEPTAVSTCQIFYGTCATAAAAKTVICDYFTINDFVPGTMLVVKFTAANTGAVESLTFQIANSSGTAIGTPHNIKYNNNGTLGNLTDKAHLKASTYSFYYDGTYWIVSNLNFNSDTDTAVRIYKDTTNGEYPIFASRTVANSITSGSTAVYGTIPSTAALVSTLNPSTGAFTFNGPIKIKTDVTYGDTLPQTGTEGQIFFQTSDLQYELPVGGTTGQALIKNSNTDRDIVWGNVGLMYPDTDAKFYITGSTSSTQNIEAAPFNTAVYVENSVLFGAAWNDYAEFRQTNILEAGRCVIENGDDTLSLSSSRMQPGAEIISDTYGFSIGKTEKCNTPIAATGRVLAYPYESREEFRKNIGKPVCSGPNGTVSIMTDEEYQLKGYCAIGFISAIPEYTVWGQNQIEVKNRVWIRIR